MNQVIKYILVTISVSLLLVIVLFVILLVQCSENHEILVYGTVYEWLNPPPNSTSLMYIEEPVPNDINKLPLTT